MLWNNKPVGGTNYIHMSIFPVVLNTVSPDANLKDAPELNPMLCGAHTHKKNTKHTHTNTHKRQRRTTGVQIVRAIRDIPDILPILFALLEGGGAVPHSDEYKDTGIRNPTYRCISHTFVCGCRS